MSENLDPWAPAIEGADGIGRILSATLIEQLNQPAELVIRAEATDFADALATLIGSTVTWQFPDPDATTDAEGPSGGVEVFVGVVGGLRLDEQTLDIRCYGAGWEQSLTTRTRSYGGVEEPAPLHELPGMGELLDIYENSDLLASYAEHALQVNESDLSFALRLIQKNGLAFISRPDGKLHLCDGDEGIGVRIELPKHSLIRHGTISMDVANVTATSRAWMVEENAETDSDVQGEGELVGPFGMALDGSGPSDPHQLLGRSTASVFEDDRRARAFAQGLASQSVRWSADLDKPHVAVGDCVTGPDNHAVHEQGPMLVVARSLSYEPRRPLHPFINHIDTITASSGLPGVPEALLERRQPAMVSGRVSETTDPTGRGRVLVRFPWSALSGSDVPGVWCSALQRFSGIRDGSAHGTWVAPQLDDWVRVLVDPDDFGPPDVMGSVYAGREKRPFDDTAMVDDHELDHLLLQTSSGIRMVAREGPGELTFYIEDNDEEMARITMHQTGDIELHAARDFIAEVDRDVLVTVGNDAIVGIGNDENVEVQHNRKSKVGNDESWEVGSKRTGKVGSDQSVQVSANDDTIVQGNAARTVQGNDDVTVSGNRSLAASGNQSQRVGGADSKQASTVSVSAGSTDITSVVTVKGALAVQ